MHARSSAYAYQLECVGAGGECNAAHNMHLLQLVRVGGHRRVEKRVIKRVDRRGVREGVRLGADLPSLGADLGGVSPVPVQMWRGRAESWWDVAGLSPVAVQMWQG
jgi:hypothetical protein